MNTAIEIIILDGQYLSFSAPIKPDELANAIQAFRQRFGIEPEKAIVEGGKLLVGLVKENENETEN